MLSDSTRVITIPAVQVLTVMASYRPNKRVESFQTANGEVGCPRNHEEKSRTIGFFSCGL